MARERILSLRLASDPSAHLPPFATSSPSDSPTQIAIGLAKRPSSDQDDGASAFSSDSCSLIHELEEPLDMGKFVDQISMLSAQIHHVQAQLDRPLSNTRWSRHSIPAQNRVDEFVVEMGPVGDQNNSEGEATVGHQSADNQRSSLLGLIQAQVDRLVQLGSSTDLISSNVGSSDLGAHRSSFEKDLRFQQIFGLCLRISDVLTRLRNLAIEERENLITKVEPALQTLNLPAHLHLIDDQDIVSDIHAEDLSESHRMLDETDTLDGRVSQEQFEAVEHWFRLFESKPARFHRALTQAVRRSRRYPEAREASIFIEAQFKRLQELTAEVSQSDSLIQRLMKLLHRNGDDVEDEDTCTLATTEMREMLRDSPELKKHHYLNHLRFSLSGDKHHYRKSFAGNFSSLSHEQSPGKEGHEEEEGKADIGFHHETVALEPQAGLWNRLIRLSRTSVWFRIIAIFGIMCLGLAIGVLVGSLVKASPW